MPRVDDNNKAFPRVIWYFEGRQDTTGGEKETGGEGWMRERTRCRFTQVRGFTTVYDEGGFKRNVEG